MSSLITALWIATLAAPTGAPQSGFDRRMMLSRPLPDQKLERGTVSVLVRKGSVPQENTPVLLLPAAAWAGKGPPPRDQVVAQGATNAEGRAFIAAAPWVGEQVRVVVLADSGVQASAPFSVPQLGGVRFLFDVGKAAGPHGAQRGPAGAGQRAPHGHGHGHGHGDAPAITGPKTKDPRSLRLWISFRVMAIEGGEVYLALDYSVINRGARTFDPGAHGLLLGVPQGAKDIALPRGTRGANVGKGGIRVTRPIPPGRHGLRLRASCKYAYDQPTVLVKLQSVVPLLGYTVSIKDYHRKIRIRGDRLTPPKRRAHDGGDLLVYRARRDAFPRRHLELTIAGLPVRSRARSWPFAGLALLLVLGSLGLTVFKGRRPSPSSRPAENEDPVNDRVRRERDRRLGLEPGKGGDP